MGNSKTLQICSDSFFMQPELPFMTICTTSKKLLLVLYHIIFILRLYVVPQPSYNQNKIQVNTHEPDFCLPLYMYIYMVSTCVNRMKIPEKKCQTCHAILIQLHSRINNLYFTKLQNVRNPGYSQFKSKKKTPTKMYKCEKGTTNLKTNIPLISQI